MTENSLAPDALLEELTALYERHAYLVWNVALRTAGDASAAAVAARRAFLNQVPAQNDARLPLDAARFAAEQATSSGIAVQRAALALGELAGASDGQVAAAFGVEVPAVAGLRARGLEELGESQEEYAERPWIEPPAELWQTVYPELHAAVNQQARAGARAVEQPAPPRARRRFRGLRRVPRIALVGIAVLGVAGVAWAATGGGGSGGGEDQPSGYSGLDGESGGSGYSAGDGSEGVSPGSEFTPEELDRLRQEEIEDLKRYTRQRGNKTLPRRKREKAGRKADHLLRLARNRQRAAEQRELAVRRALAREREARIRARDREREPASEEPDPYSDPPRGSDRDTPPRQEPEPEPRDTAPEEDSSDDGVQTECLYDAESGNYICPE